MPPNNEAEIDAASEEAMSVDVDDCVIGPDLNTHRALKDPKIYRQFIIKKNGLRCIVISDTIAMVEERHEQGNFDEDSGYESETSSVMEDEKDAKDAGGEEDGDEDEEYQDEEAGIRKAAAAMVVNTGSFYDPLCCQGTAHYLEHMLFMGTEKFPKENEYDAFLSKNGGSDNAFTELEYTLFHFDVSQEKLWQAMDMFSQFFVSPLLRPEAMERELNAIESEFQLSKNDDGCRLQELMCHTCGKEASEHPMGKFSWGNKQSLKALPEANGVDVIGEIRKFYRQFYYASNMTLVVIGAYSLDELQEEVVKYFSDVPALPREPSSLQMVVEDEGTFERVVHSPIKLFGMPFDSLSLGQMYRIVPVRDKHSLTITWQLPPQVDWKAKPADYIAHLLGHESKGSILSALRAKAWVTSCHAGVGSGGYENASSHALFSFSVTLSEEGVEYWSEIVATVYTYIGMVRHHCQSPCGLPSYIYDELKSVQDVAYQYQDEPSPEELVELVAEASTCSYLPADRLLDGNSVLQAFDGEAIKVILDGYFKPTNSRVDLTSSTFGRETDFNSGSNDDNVTMEDTASPNDGADMVESSRQKFGEPTQEPNFGTRHWCEDIEAAVLTEWEDLCLPRAAPKSSLLDVPPLNPFIPAQLKLKPLPEDDARSHPLADESETRVEDRTHFPAIPSAAPESHLPCLVSDTNGVKLYHLQDRKFKRPIAELRLRIVCAGGNQSPFVRACSDLFVTLCKDELIELCYQASTCELGSNISIDDIGFPIRVHGFDDKLLELAKEILSVFFSFRDVEEEDKLPSSIKAGRFEACLEMLLRSYRNAGIQASRYSADVRLRSIRPTNWSCIAKAKALEGIDVASFMRTVSSMLRQLSIDALLHGNVTLADAKDTALMLQKAITSPTSSILPREKFPQETLIQLPLSFAESYTIIAPTKDATESNTAVEIYFQVSKDDLKKRVLVDLLEHVLYEPLFDQLRTKEQFGYQVSCGARWTAGIIGMSFRVVSAAKSAVRIAFVIFG